MKNLKLVKFVSAVAVLTMLAAPVLSLAQPYDPNIPGVPTSVGGVYLIVVKIMQWIFTFLLIIAVIFLFFAAFSYLTAGGDPEKLGKAKSQLIYAIVAIAIALVAFGIRTIIQNFITTY